MDPLVLFRASLAEEGELNICKKYFPTVEYRSRIKQGQLVIPRYSVLPYYRELEEDVKHLGGHLINSYKEHLYVADLQNWYRDLIDYTPRTWFNISDLPDRGSFVLKGETNSKKHLWNTHMYSSNKKEAIEVMCRLQDDDFLSNQRIYAREYVPLYHLCNGLQGLPISEEYRFFVLDGKILTSAFYWSNYYEHLKDKFNLDHKNVPGDFISKIISVISSNIPFFVIDVARTRSNEWIVIELNDGQMSGLSMNDPHILYHRMRDVLNERHKVLC